MSESHSPSIVSLKKIWLVVVMMGACSIAAVIAWNLYHATLHTPIGSKTRENMLYTFAHSHDTRWYHHEEVPPSTPKTVAAPPIFSDAGLDIPPLQAAQEPSLDKVDSDRLEAMQASLQSNQIIAEVPVKEDTDTFTTAALKNPPSPYVIQTGTLIPGILMTGINADLPGQIIGQVRSNVYDSVEGHYLLIPQGSKLMGTYDSKIIYGQERVLVTWQRLMLPNGQSMALDDMAGVDNSGYAGLKDHVNAHTTKILRSGILMSVLGAGVTLSQPTHTPPAAINHSPALSQALSQEAVGSLMTTASDMTSKNLTIQPTLEIRPGYTFQVSVTKDLVFPHAYST